MSTTNDEEAKPKEREPMLSDGDLEQIIPMEDHVAYEEWSWMVHGGKFVRDDYESLITSGKLRVVEECQVHYSESVHNMPMYGCRPNIPLGGGAHCPYCGNKIKR